MAKYEYDIGVIGGGAAGLTVTSGASQLGAKTIVIEKEPSLGGDCLHYGCVPSKTLIRSAHVYHLMKNGERYGLPSVDVPPVDYRKVTARIKSVIDGIQEHDSVKRFCELGAKVVFGDPVFQDEHSVRLGNTNISAKTWVIATGSSSAVPPFPGLEDTPYITNKEIFSLDHLPESMLVLGAGPIAIEMAQSFNRLGCKVTVIQRSNQILSKEDKDMADIALGVLLREGVEVVLESTVTGIRDLGSKKEVTVKSGQDGKEINLQAETIFVAVGRKVNTGGLGLDDIGIVHDRKGIQVDSRLRTSHKHIYAAGDVIGGYQFTHAAGYEGGIIVTNAVMHLPRKTNYSFMPWCTYTDPELASIGLNEKAAKKAGIEYSVWTEEIADNDRAQAEGEDSGKIKLLLDSCDKPLGVQIIGPHAGDLLGEWIAMFNGKVKLSTLAGAIHPYPTMGEINKKVVGNIYSKKIFSDTVRKGLTFFFGFKGRACEPGECDNCSEE